MEDADKGQPVTRSDEEGRRRIGDRAYRIAEMVPGGLVWTTLILAVVLSFIEPRAVIYFIIVFDLFWLLRVSYFVIFLLVSWGRYRKSIATDWSVKAVVLPRFSDLHHLIFLPTYKEDIEIIRTTLNSLVAAVYPGKENRFMVVLAGEEGDKERFLANAAILEKEFAGKFHTFLVTLHPKGLVGEMPGKGSNINWAGHRAKEVVDKLGIQYDDVVVSSFDVDTCVHPQYFVNLSYIYLTHPTPTRVSYQPIALYNNNMWDAPALVRVAAFGTTFWLMTELTRPERLQTFSSHSMSFRALTDVDFWQKDIVTEDSRIFLQCLLRYNGDYAVVPMYIPVSMDTVMAEGYWQSLKNLYLQQRRWAWGVEHFPFLVSRFWKNSEFPLDKKIFHLRHMVGGMYTWATAPLVIFILGYLPFWVAPERMRSAVLFQTTPHTLEALMRLAMLGIFVSAMVSFTLLPPRPAHRKYGWIVMVLQWALVPITFGIFGSLPAIDAQTKLMRGKYLGFNVTEKKRKS